MRVLVIADEVWNDYTHGNNVLTNWLNGFPAEMSMICCSPGKMSNNVCKHYFQITDAMMAKSFLSGKGAGIQLDFDEYPSNHTEQNVAQENKKLYTMLKSISGDFMRWLREYIWVHGKYDEAKLKSFLDKTNPDIIFSTRRATGKLLRLEYYVKEYTGKPIIAYTGDNEESTGVKPKGVFAKAQINRIRKMMKAQVPNYALYYTHSIRQAKEYAAKYGIKTKVIQKCGNFLENRVHNSVSTPIHLVYAGKLYCKRWETLAAISKALERINSNGVRMLMDIYTVDHPTKKQYALLNNGRNSFLHEAVPANELPQIFAKSDAVLHVESFIPYYVSLTQYSVSTKVIDCLASGCAVLAICDSKQAGLAYLRAEDAAITISHLEDIEKRLRGICNETKIITQYARKAYECGMRNHQRSKVHEILYRDFEIAIKDSK